MRKEVSWNGWRDKNIKPQEFANEPTSGFVLNKKVGDYKSDWSHRHAYCRVYDSRDFEFEITIENLLYILENANSIKGKGLEGEFVYGWDGKDLLLIPCDSPDYKEITKYNEILHQKNYIKAKELILGGTYKTKSNDEYIYMGRFDYYDTKSERVYKDNSRYSYEYVYTDINKGKYYYFVLKENDRDSKWFSILTLKSLGEKFIDVVSSECVENYADLFDKLECNTHYSPIDKSKDEYISYTLEEFSKRVNDGRWWFYCYDLNKNNINIGRIHTSSGYYIEDRNTYKKSELYSIEEIFNMIQPMYKNTYLQNNKLYQGGK